MAKDTPADAGKPKGEPLFIQVWSEYHEAKAKNANDSALHNDKADAEAKVEA